MKKTGPWKTLLKGFLFWLVWPLSWVFWVLVETKNKLFDWGWLRSSSLSKPVISIGNLAMGGTGKSPLTMALIAFFQDRGLKVGVLSRGYGRRNPKLGLRVTAETDYRDGGDEPVMMARRFPDVLIGVGPSRLKAAEALGEVPDVYLVDDGFQHRQLARDLDIVLLDVTQSEPKLFPRGNFREGWRGLRRADVVVLTRCRSGDDRSAWQKKIGRVNSTAIVLACDFQPQALLGLDGRPVAELTGLKGRKVAAFAGIGNPKPFFESLERLGAILLAAKPLADHEPFEAPAREAWLRSVQEMGAEMIVTTEKDAVKLDNHAGFGIVIAFLSTGVAWIDETVFFNLLEQIATQKDPE